MSSGYLIPSPFFQDDINRWKLKGRPSILNEKTVKLANELAVVYDFNCLGGHLKPMLLTWELSNHTIDYYLTIILPDAMKYTERRQINYETRCLETMLTMKEEERYSALALVHGLIYTKFNSHKHKFILSKEGNSNEYFRSNYKEYI